VDSASDEQLIVCAIAGDVDAFKVLQRRHGGRMFRIVRRIVANDFDAEDACQEAWFLAHRHLGDLQDSARFAAWIGRIVVRCARARMRTRPELVSFDEADPHLPEANELEPERFIDTERLWRRTERAIGELLPSHQAVVFLRELEDMTTTEVAEVLGTSEENVRVRIHRARTTLRLRLQSELGDENDDLVTESSTMLDAWSS
jgi:RNA polymerase sigma-70 factor (ECF subfamily)